MICPNCQTPNGSENIFCVNCGTKVLPTGNLVGDTKSPTLSFQNPLPNQPPQNTNPTEIYQPPASIPQTQFVQPPPNYNTSNSMVTSAVPLNQPSAPNFMSAPNFSGAQTQAGNSSKKTFIWAALVFFGILAVGVGGFFLLTQSTLKTEVFPDHLGMFLQSPNKDKVEEIKKQDFTNAVEGTDKLLKDDSLTIAESKPNLILYADSKEIPLNDLRLIQLDTIKPNGTMKQIDFQAAPVEGKPDIKRIRIPEGLANGKYAFAVLEGNLDDGKHKFWAFQVKNSEKTNNDSILKSTNISVKTKETNTSSTNTKMAQQPKIPPPAGSTPARVNIGNVVLRSGPSQYSGAIGKLFAGQRVYVLGYSGEFETFVSPKTGKSYYSNYAQVQTESGKQGWVYAAFLN